MTNPAFIEALTVCCGYDDFLAAIIPHNLPLFDRWVIVTEPRDEATRHICRRFGLECLLSEEGRDHGEFAKGRLIERGLQHLSVGGWRLHLDADIVLPPHFRRHITTAALQEDTIYGIDRAMIRSWSDWQRLLASGYLDGSQHTGSHAVNFPRGYELGSRWASPLTGWVPIGFFQLWHSSQDLWWGVRSRPYPRLHNDACRTDVQHGLQWDRKRRALLPEIVGVHLESEPCPTGTNWRGRKSRRFGPDEAKSASSSAPS